MAKINVVCLVVDHLSAAYLGAYGNTWVQTPALDRLAAESLVFDRAIIDTPEIAAQYRSLWYGLHALCPASRQIGKLSLPAQMAAAGYHTALVSDAAAVATFDGAADFAEHNLLGAAGSNSEANCGKSVDTATVKESAEATDAANFFLFSQECLAKLRDPFFAWLHTSTLGRIWDAPLEFRSQYADEEDPTPTEFATVPNKLLEEKFDPDALLAMTHAYAGQVSLLDELIGGWWESLVEAGLAKNLLFVLLSPRGFPLGEHRRVGKVDHALYAELTHVPLLIRLPPSSGGIDRFATGCTARTQAIVQPADLPATILDFCEMKSSTTSATKDQQEEATSTAGIGRSLLPLFQGAASSQFDRACIVAPNQHGLVTSAWSLRGSSLVLSNKQSQSVGAANPSTATKQELFVKPDDWFEINEVSNRCGEIVEKMETVYAQFSEACQSEAPAMLSPLPEELEESAE